MTNPIRQKLLTQGVITTAPRIPTRVDPQAAQARQHELVGRKVQKAQAVFAQAVRREGRA